MEHPIFLDEPAIVADGRAIGALNGYGQGECGGRSQEQNACQKHSENKVPFC